MANEALDIASVLDAIGRDVIKQLADIPDDLLNKPLDLPETNTLFALATHLVGAGEFWVLALAGGWHIERDRQAEFHATGQGADLLARYERWLENIHKVLDTLPDSAMGQHVDPPATYRARMHDQSFTVRDCLLHALEHSALHQGHIQLTRQVLLGKPPANNG
ncbi:MAG TPA: DinB family protein [Ktedonobacterales bacterium]|jgi:uncharacterized damage-inducible protein DinB